MIRVLLLGVALLGFSVGAVACDDDTDSDSETVATSTQPAVATEPAGGTPTEPLSSEVPQDVIDAVTAYVASGNIPSFPPATELKLPEDCTTAGDVCYDPSESSFDETTATVKVYPYASDDIQNLQLVEDQGEWAVVSTGDAIE